MPWAFMELVEQQALCVGKPSKKAVRDCGQSSSFFGGKESVVFNKTMVSLDFFCFVFVIKQKNESPRFVATEAPALRRANDMKETNVLCTQKKKE